MDSRLIWLALAAFVGSTEGGLIAGLLPSISADMRISIGQAGLMVFGYALAYAIGTPLIAVLLGGIGRRRILAGSELGLAVCALLLAITPLFEGLVAIRTLLAVAAGTFTGTAMATAAMIAPTGQRGRYMQVISVGQSLASLVGVPLGAWAATEFGWRVNYWAIAIMAAAAALALYVKLPRGMPGDTQTMRDRIRVLRNPGIVPAIASTFVFTVGYAPLTIYVGAVMADSGVGIGQLPLVLLSGGIGALLCSFTAGALADRLGNRPASIIMAVLVLVVLAAYATLPHLPEMLRLAALLLVVGVQGYLVWAYWIAVSSEVAYLAPTSVPVAISLNMAAFNLGMAVAAALGGVVVDAFGATALAYVGMPFILMTLAFWLPARRRSERPAGRDDAPRSD